MTLSDFIRQMPKVELHVHISGSIEPHTLLQLAEKYQVALPATDIDGLKQWYTYTNFDHFMDIYLTIFECIRSAEDIELVMREFLIEQARQNILHTEMTYTPYYSELKGITFEDQLEAISRATAWAEAEHSVTMGWIIDIPREVSPEIGMKVAEQAVSAMNDGVVALGLGGPEIGNPPEKFTAAFEFAHKAGLPSVPHAGETVRAESIWGALNSLHAIRIGHGVRCLEDPALVAELRDRQIPLEVCPTSNVCLHVVPDFESHPLPQLLAEGLYVTVNSDDPAMFNITLTDEYIQAAQHFDWDADLIEQLVMNAARASLLPDEKRDTLTQRIQEQFAELKL